MGVVFLHPRGTKMAILLRIFHRTFFESLIKTEASAPSSYLFSSSNPFASPLLRFISTNPLAHFSNNNTTDSTKELESGTVKKLIWEDYKRNHKGAIPPQKTRLRCKRRTKKHIVGNPCPICRDNIEIEYTDVKLLVQFICPYTGKILPATKTGLCRLQQKKLVTAIEKAWDYGLMTYTIPRETDAHSTRMESNYSLSWNKIDVIEPKH